MSPRYLTKYVNLRSTSNYQTRFANKNNLQEFSCRTESFKHSFFPFSSLRMEQIRQLRNFFSLNQISLFPIHDPVGVKLRTKLRLQFSHLNEHKIRHNFKDCVSPMCDRGAETETTCHFFLRCQSFSNERQKFCDNVYRIDALIKNLNEESLIDVLLCGLYRFNDSKNKQILLHKICYIQTTKRFEDFLLTSTNFVQSLPLCFSLICLLKLHLQCNLLSSCTGDIRQVYLSEVSVG